VARRLRVLQEYAGLNQVQMAQTVNMSTQLWNHLLLRRELSRMNAFKIREAFPEISLEGLWFGEKDFLTLQTARALDEIERRLL
jgi:hypothetical protein